MPAPLDGAAFKTVTAKAMADCDVLIVGGGIAGASLGAELAGRLRTLLIDSESVCGYHSTGRSAAFWLESYGGAEVARLTAASWPALERAGLLRQRGALHISREEWPDIPKGIDKRRLERAELERLVPGILPGWRYGLLEPGCADIDVAGLHADCLARMRAAGGVVQTDKRLIAGRRSGKSWTVELQDGSTLRASTIVNAAGAWADQVADACAVRPLGISPKRRTMVQLRVGKTGLRSLPLVSDADGTFYFKGEGDRTVWLSPHDEIDTDPCDAAPEEMDVAIAIDRFQQVVDWPVEAVERKWAGLRSFAPDRLPVYGFDPDQRGFFWCGGQGGYGIQTAPAAARLAAALVLGEERGFDIVDIDPGPFLPNRLR